MSRSLKLIAVLGFAALAVTACGKRGALEPPAAQTKTSKGPAAPQKASHRSNPLDVLLE